MGNLVIALPAAYALIRYPVPGKKLMLTAITLPLYVPGAVIGLSLLLTYYFAYHLATSMWGLVFAMMVGTFPLMLTPIVVAMKDLPVVFEEAAQCLGATRFQTFRRVVFPLIGPGVSAGLMLTFIIVFNEYLVTLFVHPTTITTAPLRIFNVIRTAGLLPTTAALAVGHAAHLAGRDPGLLPGLRQSLLQGDLSHLMSRQLMSRVRFASVQQALWPDRRRRRLRPRRRRWRVRDPARSVRMWQDHDPAHDRRAHRTDRGPDPLR